MACAIAGCAHMDVATLAASSLSLACDWGQTRSAADRGWVGHAEENAILGRRPTTMQVDMYFGVAALLNATLWAALPKGWRSAAPAALVGVEVDSIRHNIDTTSGHCGI